MPGCGVPENDEDQTIRLIARVLSGNASQAERAEFKSLPPEKIRAYRKLWELTGKAQSPALSTDLWPEVRSRIQAGRATPPDVPATARFWQTSAFRAAAMVFVLLLSILLWRTMFPARVTVATRNAETKVVHLPDGSQVELNAASRLTYSRKHRQLQLEGEAFFQVQPAREPFVVTTGRARVTVLGTAFDVRSRREKVVVAVEHGHVRFENVRTGKHVVLGAAEMSRMQGTENPTVPVAADLDASLAWRRGRLVFDRTPVAEVLDELARTYDVSFTLTNIDTANLTLTASFKKEQPLQDVLTAVSLTFDWDFRQTEKGYALFRRGERR